MNFNFYFCQIFSNINYTKWDVMKWNHCYVNYSEIKIKTFLYKSNKLIIDVEVFWVLQSTLTYYLIYSTEKSFLFPASPLSNLSHVGSNSSSPKRKYRINIFIESFSFSQQINHWLPKVITNESASIQDQ